MKRKRIDWELIGVVGVVVGVLLMIGLCVLSLKVNIEQRHWLDECARKTHGSLEREMDGMSHYTDRKGNPSSSSVNWHYFVRAGNGRRIEYQQDYSEDLQ